MNPSPPRPTYHPARIALHWLTLLLLVAVFATIEARVLFVKGTPERDLMKTLHFMLGVSVLLPAVLRLVGARLWQAPPVSPAMPALQTRLSHAMHALLYVWLLAMPLTGWIVNNSAGQAVTLFGLELPRLAGTDKAFSKALEDWHEWMGTAGYFLVGAHALAALLHHYVVRDDTLSRMLPWLRRRAARTAPAQRASAAQAPQNAAARSLTSSSAIAGVNSAEPRPNPAAPAAT
jgi:cytochrome b561